MFMFGDSSDGGGGTREGDHPLAVAVVAAVRFIAKKRTNLFEKETFRKSSRSVVQR